MVFFLIVFYCEALPTHPVAKFRAMFTVTVFAVLVPYCLYAWFVTWTATTFDFKMTLTEFAFHSCHYIGYVDQGQHKMIACCWGCSLPS